jgi:hypothetical protein
VTTTPQSAPAGGQITVAGNGTPGTTVQILLRPANGPTVDPGVQVVVPANGQWSTPVTLPADLAPGPWDVAARVVGCDTEATTQITVTGGGGGPTTTTTTTTTVAPTNPTTPTVNPVVAGQSTDKPLPATAVVESASTSKAATATAADPATAKQSGLAFTGSNVRLPVLAGITMVVVGTLVLLRRRPKRT